ncbi:hypothetical protein MN116_002331 [Schistosoma mekongi]|uniref:Protein kinase domain-containing protein n=1 Tax=Schistosoma mekongi TaxID=38744 RepID=A0AAE2D8R6_SCHME|nr:hypothetical protein MN116_002331 [Schistosoma mekongi]
MCQRLGLAIFLLWIIDKLFCFSSGDGCFGLFEKLKWNRTFSFSNKVLTLKLEVTDNPEHWIVNYLFEILARERLGYTKIDFVSTEDNNISSSLKKLQCFDPQGNSNHTSPKYQCSSTIDVVNQNFSDYRTETVKNSDLLNNHSSFSGKSITILDFELNSTCLRYNSYSIPPPPLCSTDARSTSINGHQYCHTESYQAVKVTWSELRTAAPQIFQLASKMYMSQDELEGLVHSAMLDSNIDRKSVYKQVACRWLRQNPTKWKSWTIGWDKKLNLTIAGLFSMYGKWVLYGLDRVAQEAMNFVNADSDYFRNSEYALSLDVRNLTCEPDVVLSDYFKVLENAVNTRLIGSIAALCSDSIEAVVELANVRKQIIVSPTVGSARFLEQQQYHYFFRTVPSMTLANFILLRLFLIWGWHRIVVFRKSDHFFEPLLFQAKGIEIIANIEMDEQQLTYKLAKDTLEELRQQNSRIFVVEYDARGTYLILCAAYHEGMHFSAGYVWFLNPWLSDQWWSGLIDRNTECTFNEMLNITSWTFTVGHQLLIGPMVHSFIPRTSEFMDSDSKSGNNSSGIPNRTSSFEQIRRKRHANVQSQNLEEPPVLSRIRHNPNPNDFEKSTFSAHSQHKLTKDPLHDYTVYTYDAVILLASAVVHLLRENPAASSALNHPDVSETLRTLVARTNFGYRFQTGDSTTGQSNEIDVSVAGINDDNFGVDAGFQLAGDYYGIRSQSPASASNLRFNDHNERIADYWLLKQRHLNTTVPIIMWSTKIYEEVHERDQQQSFEPFSHMISSNNMSNKYDWKTLNAPFLYDEFQKRMTERWLDHVNWHTLGGPPSDGSVNEENCTLPFLSNQLRMGCTGATVFVTVTVTVLVLLPLIIFAHFYYRRKLKEIENRTRKPFEELCAELADLDMPAENIVLNRRVGQGAFGLVYGGEAKKNDLWEAVAVKVINEKATYEGKIDFLSEAKLMRSLNHPNVVRLIGISLNPKANLYLIMELMLLGDLKTYLLSRRILAQRSPNHEDIRPSTLTQMSMDIGQGVAYLHSKHLIHRDIACRNCLVTADRTVKIGDFGLTRQAAKNTSEVYYRFTRNCELPIRWMSPEAVQFGVFSIQSDIWSFGITLYEIITFGVFPYNGLGDVEVVERIKRMEFSITEFLPPQALNTIVCELINHCCKHQWQHRPSSMNQVLEVLTAYPDCIRPFLTDDPPKPNTTMDSLPFQPPVGTCIISESAMTGLAAVDSVGGCTGGFRTMRSASTAAVPMSSCSPSPIPLNLPDANNDKYYVHEKRLSEQTNLRDGSTLLNHTVFNRPNNYTSNRYADNSTSPKLNSCESYQLPMFPSVTDENEEQDMMLSKSDEPSFVPVFDTYFTSFVTSVPDSIDPSTNILFKFPTSPILSTTPSYQTVNESTQLIMKSGLNDQYTYSTGTTLHIRKQKRSNTAVLNGAKSDIPDEFSSLLSDNQLQLFLNADSSMNVEESNRSLMLITKSKYLNKHYFTTPKSKPHMLHACSLPRNLVNMRNFNHLRRTRSLVYLTASCYNMQRLQNKVKYKHCISSDHINLVATQADIRSHDLILPPNLSTFSSDPFIPSRK